MTALHPANLDPAQTYRYTWKEVTTATGPEDYPHYSRHESEMTPAEWAQHVERQAVGGVECYGARVYPA
jgi:hypothetical protein